mmetsp:Transcript_142381/g.265350  ORF Transcript_142381/g.265350 Transcript_142381/m.265350 type:complete len:242 (-) Transcript_142381:4324-5049(-)
MLGSTQVLVIRACLASSTALACGCITGHLISEDENTIQIHGGWAPCERDPHVVVLLPGHDRQINGCVFVSDKFVCSVFKFGIDAFARCFIHQKIISSWCQTDRIIPTRISFCNHLLSYLVILALAIAKPLNVFLRCFALEARLRPAYGGDDAAAALYSRSVRLRRGGGVKLVALVAQSNHCVFEPLGSINLVVENRLLRLVAEETCVFACFVTTLSSAPELPGCCRGVHRAEYHAHFCTFL